MTSTIDDTIDQAVTNYVQDNGSSLDPISKRQIQAWSFQWTNTGTVDEADQECHSYSGRLTWKTTNEEHPLYIILTSSCSWIDTSLDWTCRVRADVTDAPNESKPKKIYKRLRDRLEADDYISKLLIGQTKMKKVDHDGDETTVDGVILAQASVQTPDSGLEERVFTDSDVAEGIKRTIWNTAQDPIEILEFVIQYLPLLPCQGLMLPSTTKLANRAALRLLEDAMCDACDREGEEELVQDLQIQKKSRQCPES